MEVVHADIKNYLQRNIFPSRTVLVFPPFNGFRRFLIHKLIEDNFSSSEVAAFSIGQDINRRIVICYKGLIREGQIQTPGSQTRPDINMLERDRPVKQRSTPTAAVYRPPAARMASSRKSTGSATPSKSTDSKRVRRPDQQMYVPRPKRASFGSELPRSRSHSSSRTSLESDSYDKLSKCSSNKNEDSRDSEDEYCKALSFSETLETSKSTSTDETSSRGPKVFLSASKDTETTCMLGFQKPADVDEPHNNTVCPTQKDPSTEEVSLSNINNTPISEQKSFNNTDLKETPNQDVRLLDNFPGDKDVSKMEVDNLSECDNPVQNESKSEKEKFELFNKSGDSLIKNEDEPTENLIVDKDKDNMEKHQETSSTDNLCSKVETIETISLSSGSVEEDSSGSSTLNGSTSSDSSSDSRSSSSSTSSNSPNTVKKKKSTNKQIFSQEEKDVKSNNKVLPISEVLVISDTSSSYDSVKTSTVCDNKTKKSKSEMKTEKQEKDKKSESKHLNFKSKSKVIDPSECDWESLYDESGECLVPSLMEELTSSVGRVRVTSVDNDYRPYQSIEERTSDGECVIEIYDFPSAFTTTDLLNVFAAYRNKNFQVKWVDDTHALGIFPSPLIADEVLACTLPFVKTRPLRLAIAESRNKARNLVLPALPAIERPKTCTALARRLVSGALGLRLPTTSQERERERAVLKEAREKRRLEAKQKEAAWEGTLTSQNCI